MDLKNRGLLLQLFDQQYAPVADGKVLYYQHIPATGRGLVVPRGLKTVHKNDVPRSCM
jgi:hypothetical protein